MSPLQRRTAAEREARRQGVAHTGLFRQSRIQKIFCTFCSRSTLYLLNGFFHHKEVTTCESGRDSCAQLTLENNTMNDDSLPPKRIDVWIEPLTSKKLTEAAATGRNSSRLRWPKASGCRRPNGSQTCHDGQAKP
jgi:hypothetical protein